jgi:hypothetical protein
VLGEGDAETRPEIEELRSVLEDGRMAWARGGVEPYIRL